MSEVRIFLQVSHKNIVQLLEVYESDMDQAVLLVMVLCTGGEFEKSLFLQCQMKLIIVQKIAQILFLYLILIF